ncbi:uncharacterized protein LOC127723344 [Mytilus californianus]|uniref:uncharacterized protein LOC127723344 n=1 Tax=Mytilus californianus TaxID=6549 RepID=UPI0022479ED7|nr:uncharacterized protein LOC127723344 [Mytilus californianus]
MEYLQHSTGYNKDYLSWTGNDLKQRDLYKHLVNTVGTEIDIRKRQQLFIIHDKIFNISRSDLTEISSGSLAEGLDLPGSDIDLMYVIKHVDVVQDVKNIIHPVQRTTLVMETDTDYPGFTRLRLIAGGERETRYITSESFESDNNGLYLSVNKFISHIHKLVPHRKLSSHGPCLSDNDQCFDYAFCLRSKHLPYNTIPWASRRRQQWPPNPTIDKIRKYGCLFVPIGPRTMPGCDVKWRLSFSVAEKQLVHSFNFTQLLCYCLLKLTLKRIVNTNKHAEGLLCSYFLKTALFWVSEELDIDTFEVINLFVCFSHCLNKLILWVNNCYCPNYFIPEQNMFLGKISPDNHKILIHVLESIKCDGIEGLIKQLFSQDNGTYRLLRTYRESSFIMVDLLFYRIHGFHVIVNTLRCLETLIFAEYLLKSKSCTFIIEVCKCYHARISQNAAQLLPTPTITTETYNIHKRYHRHLKDGIKADAISGWLLYASFYYVTGQFNVTLKLTDYVLSKCLSDMVLVGCVNYCEGHKHSYRNHVHSAMTLNERMRIATIHGVNYTQHSSLIPGELQLEVNDQTMTISPILMSHCLRFLCFHHLGDIFNRQQALHDLYLTVMNGNFVSFDNLSVSITILGVCYELSGDKDTAYQCFNLALHCDGGICLSAEARISKLLEN